MKNLILCLTLAVFAVGAQAGQKKEAAGKDACCPGKVAAAACQTKSSCAVKAASCKTPGKQALLSPKAAGEVRK